MNVFVIKARSLARRLGLIGVINRLRPSAPYEERFHEALTQGVKPGDVVWDVGANVGLYTELFCQWTGETGAVVAFEPGTEACQAIRDRIQGCGWLTIENVAMGENDATGRLVLEEGSSVDNHIQTDANPSDADAASIPVVICRADTVARRLGRVPNVVKVDVEGFEEEVLLGFGDLMSAPELRSLFVEVHFLKLENRGRATAPVRIEKLLKSNGFQTRWADPSHIVATR